MSVEQKDLMERPTKADKSGVGGIDPQDCDWPVCGCDPHANKVIEALDEAELLVYSPSANKEDKK